MKEKNHAMTDEELAVFKSMFRAYCRREINRGVCSADSCEFCPIQEAYEEICKFEKIGSAIQVVIYDIQWDTDGDAVELPAEITHTFDGYFDINDEDLIDEISDWLSDEDEYCHDGFKVRRESNEKS